ncbi:FG-GAP repeat domain-containing protein [Caldimonas thermodepolymerans]|jgi:FG-GAP repeat.|uniref:FG-GAP repeat domain-containing protein n=1 Tax=Caldimonas thermodepolymerans TaxID=215580 RepID=UPI00249027F4|nr:VCBS repeat-containing protein [Caldimonas thermodepolymerans]
MNHPVRTALASALIAMLAACGGGGGSDGPRPDPDSQRATETSYANFKQVGLTPQTLPAGREGVGVVRAYGDFSGSGGPDLFAASLTYSPAAPQADATPAVFEFWRKQPDGSFVLDTTMLSSSAGCIHPRKALVADFNGDEHPDVFVACHGYDAAPFPGERNKVLLSQANGTYKLQDASSDVGFHHSASAADLDGDGDIDVLVVNHFDPKTAYVLLNDGNGKFSRESTPRLPSSIGGKPYFSVELVDLDEDGDLDVLLGGHEWEGADTIVLLNPGNYDFRNVTPVKIPKVANEGVVLDFAVTGTGASRTLWVLRTSGGDGTFYKSRTVQKVTWPGLVSSTPLLERDPGKQWFQWILPATLNGQAVITSEDASVGVEIPQ